MNASRATSWFYEALLATVCSSAGCQSAVTVADDGIGGNASEAGSGPCPDLATRGECCDFEVNDGIYHPCRWIEEPNRVVGCRGRDTDCDRGFACPSGSRCESIKLGLPNCAHVGHFERDSYGLCTPD